MGRDTLDKILNDLVKDMNPPVGDERYPQGYRQALADVMECMDMTESSAYYYLLATKTQYERF